MSRDAKLAFLIEPVVRSFGCELWGVEFSMSGRRGLLRVYIDKEGGIDIGDCERISRQLANMLDVENPIAGQYTLEVSSPGLDRPLYDVAQYRRFLGHDISVRLRSAFEGRRKYLGRLMAVEDGEVVIACGEHEYLFPLADIERANLVPRFHGNA